MRAARIGASVNQPVVFDFDGAVYVDSCRWIADECTGATDLHTAVGIDLAEFAALETAGIIPRPTYEIYDTGIVSPVASLGAAGHRHGIYYGPAIIGGFAEPL